MIKGNIATPLCVKNVRKLQDGSITASMKIKNEKGVENTKGDPTYTNRP